MPIQRRAVTQLPKRQKDELIEKHKRIGECLGLKTVPQHTLAWKEERLELDSGDCYPLVDVLDRIATLLFEQMTRSAKKAEPKQASAKKK